MQLSIECTINNTEKTDNLKLEKVLQQDKTGTRSCNYWTKDSKVNKQKDISKCQNMNIFQ